MAKERKISKVNIDDVWSMPNAAEMLANHFIETHIEVFAEVYVEISKIPSPALYDRATQAAITLMFGDILAGLLVFVESDCSTGS